MSDAARQLREFLEARDGHHEVPVSELVGPWDEGSRETLAAQLTGDLDAVGVSVEPPLAQCGPDTVIRLQIVGREESSERAAPEPVAPQPAEPAAEEPPEPAAARSPEPVAEAQPAPAPPSTRKRRSLAWRPPIRPAAAGLVAVVLLAIVLVAAGAFGSDDPEGDSRDERTSFCDSDAGATLTDAEIVALDEPGRLPAATDSALQSAGSAPPGTDCAVFALESLVEAWQQSPDRAEAARQIRRIEEFQRAEQLVRPRF